MHFDPCESHCEGSTPLSIVPPSGWVSCAKAEQEGIQSAAASAIARRDTLGIVTSKIIVDV